MAKKDPETVKETEETVSLTQEQIQALIQEGIKKAMASAPAPVINVIPGKRAPSEKPGEDDPEVIAYLSERVPFKAFKDNNKYKDDIVVGHNGKFWQIKRGIQVMIPRYIYNLIEDAEKQLTEAANYQLELEKDFENRKKVLE